MDRNEKQTLMKAINYKNFPTTDNKKPVTEKTPNEKYTKQKPIPEKPMEMNFDLRTLGNKALYKSNKPTPQESIVSEERLQEAIIWSEILGKPLSKRRKRR